MDTRASHSSDELRLDAATLAFALLRFAAGAAHPDGHATPEGMLHAGTQCYLFTPSWRRVPLADVPPFLAELASLEQTTSPLHLEGDAHVLLQFDAEEYCYPISVLREWCACYGVDVGWTLRAFHDDARAQARLMLHRSDGAQSWGDAWPIRRRLDDQAT